MNKRLLGLIAMLIAALGLAIAVILMKVLPAYTNMLPQHVAIWRFTIAAPILWLFLSLKRQPKRVIPDHPWWFLVLGVIFSVASFSAVFALQRLSSSIYVIIFYIYPSLVVFYALITGGTVPRLFWLGLPLTLLGLVLTSFEFGAALAIDPIGLLITLVNAAALAAYMIISEIAFKRAGDQISGTNGVMTGAMLVGLLLIPILGIDTPDTIQGWGLLVIFSIFGTLMPILAMSVGLNLLTAARGSVIITVQPVLNVLLAMLLLNETLSLQQWIGGGLVITAVILLERSPDRLQKVRVDQEEYAHVDVTHKPSHDGVQSINVDWDFKI
jgi:drug/metabolite transporter (DMT)-like permease